MKYGKDNEKLLEELQLEAVCLYKLHLKCYERNKRKSIRVNIPIIILSAVCGSANFIAGSYPSIEEYIILTTGALSIITGIISSISQYLKLDALSQSHLTSYLQWYKFSNMIKFNIRIKKKDRTDVKDFLNNVLGEYERLWETSPPVPSMEMRKLRRRINLNEEDIPSFMDGIKNIKSYNDDVMDTTISISPPFEEPLLEEKQPPSVDSSVEV